MRKRVAIIHYHPLELYPPVQNLINFLAENFRVNLTICTTTSKNKPSYINASIKLHRLAKYSFRRSFLIRYLEFSKFIFFTLVLLIIKKPKIIIYYDSHSSYPCYFYKKYFNSEVKLYIHYHEYMTNEEYAQKGMQLINFFHKKEHDLYQKATWISHTNEQRMNLFLEDHPFINTAITRIMPNYPPKAWSKSRIKKTIGIPVRFIYVGSFASFETLYIKDFLEWVKHQNGNALLDIYSFNIPPHISKFINNLNCKFINHKGSVDYNKLPMILSRYDIGVILYKGHSKNVVYCASNKLFEYLACDLDVWVSKEMIGSQPYVTASVYPKVLLIDYTILDKFDLNQAISRNGLVYKPAEFYSETVYSKLGESITNA